MTVVSMEWISPAGETHPLVVEWDLVGVSGDATALFTDAPALRAGSSVRGFRRGPRRLVLPLMLTASSRDLVGSLLDQTLGAFAQRSADGKLRATTSTGRVRELSCRAEDVMVAQTFGAQSGDLHQRVTVALFAADPFWHPVKPSTERFIQSSGGTTTTFLGDVSANMIRLQAGPVGSVFGQRSIANNGVVAAYPVWYVTGPGSGLTLTNLTTDKTLEVTRSLTQGQSMVIDCRVGTVTVDGVNAYADLANSSPMWPLEPGAQNVKVEMTNTTALTEVNVAWLEGHLSP